MWASIVTAQRGILRQLYGLLPRDFQRLLLRTVSAFKIKGNPKIFVCKKYIQLTVDNVDNILTRHKNYTAIQKIIEENSEATEPATHLDTQNLEAVNPLVAKAETVILEIANKNFSFRDNHLFDDEMNVLDECGMKFERMPIYRKLLSPQIVNVAGTVAYLSNVEPTNYYHWMCRTLPLIRLYKMFFDLKEIDFFYIGQFPLANFHRESLERAGIGAEKMLQKACTADRIIAAFSSRTQYFGAAPVLKENYCFTKSLFQPDIQMGQSVPMKRIYVTRGNVKRRKVINEEQVVQSLEKYGFTTVSMDGKSLREQIQIFASAEAIVAPHGAALTNLLFIQPGTKVIELFPYGYVNNCFYALANYAKACYFYLQGEQINQPNFKQLSLKRSNIDEHHLDLKIDIDKFEQICRIAF